MSIKKVPSTQMEVLKSFPGNVPARLIREYKKIVKGYKTQGGYQRKLAKKLEVNIKYVHDLLVHGIEPTDRTEKGQATRIKLFLPKQYRKPVARKHKPLPDYIKKWRRLPTLERNKVIQQYIQWKESKNE